MATVILKCTQRCNSNCAYCDSKQYSRGILDMPLETLETVFIRINEYLASHPNETLRLTWHGGEPLLLGAGYFETARELQQRQCPDTSDRIGHCMQSNLTLISKGLIRTLKNLGIHSLGTSYDPCPHVRGFGPDIDSRAYSTAFLRGTTLLETHSMGWGFIYVVTRQSLENPLNVFHTLANLKPGCGFNMNPVIISDDRRKHLSITPVEYADFLGAIFPFWYEHKDRYTQIEPFDSMMKNLEGDGLRLGCGDSRSCARNHICIDPNGDVSQCGRTMELGIMQWGNINDKSIDELFNDDQLGELQRRSELLENTDCAGCKLFPICHGGCPIDAYVKYGSFDRKTGWCEWKKRFVFSYVEPITGLKAERLSDYT